jgi:ABC-type antimicrobial peptide transport system permease subunit
MARRWAGRIRTGDKTFVVVGIARDIKYREITESAMPFLYFPFSQLYEAHMTLHIETSGDPAAMAAPVIAEIRRLDHNQPVTEVSTLQHLFEEGGLFFNRLLTQLISTIGSFGLLPATIGLYGVIAYSLSRRTREIGIRMAIGAGRRDVLGLVLRQGAILVGTGVVLGLGMALLLSPVLKDLLVGVSARDPVVFVAVPLALSAIGLIACYVPAHRAVRVDPLTGPRGGCLQIRATM